MTEMTEMSLSDWEKLVARIEIGGALPIQLSVRPLPYSSHYGAIGQLCMEMRVPCVKTGAPIRIAVKKPLPGLDLHRALDWIRSEVHWFYRHEADEQFKVDGHALYQPWHEH